MEDMKRVGELGGGGEAVCAADDAQNLYTTSAHL